MSLPACERVHSLPSARTWRMHKLRFSYATLVDDSDDGLPSTQLYAADDLVSAFLDTDTEGSRQPSIRSSTTQSPAQSPSGKHGLYDDWSDITTLEKGSESLDADVSRAYHKGPPSDYDDDANDELRIESRARRLRRRARRRLSEAMEKARNGWTYIFLAILHRGKANGSLTIPHIF